MCVCVCGCVCVCVYVCVCVCMQWRSKKMKKISLKVEEALASAVEKYPWLYNKADPGYKEKDRQQNAWVKIEKTLALERGKTYFAT